MEFNRKLSPHSPSLAHPADAALEGRVLVVDDEPGPRRFFSRCLERFGAQVSVASNAEEALALLERGSYDLLITDVDMPGASGLWLAEAAKSRWRRLPVIVVTGITPDETGMKIIDRYCAGLLLKPVSLEQLEQTVARTLCRRRPD